MTIDGTSEKKLSFKCNICNMTYTIDQRKKIPPVEICSFCYGQGILWAALRAYETRSAVMNYPIPDPGAPSAES